MRANHHIAKAWYVAVVVVCVSMLIAALGAAPALAHRGRVFGPSFGSPGSGAGQLSLVSFAPNVVGGSGLAVDEATHNVFVADTGNKRLYVFTSAGGFVRAWGWGVVNGASEFQVCTEATGCRAGLSGANLGEFETPAFVAVDDSPGGQGDVYVADYHEGIKNQRVQKFTSAGALVGSWGNKGQIDETSVPPSDAEGEIKFYTITGLAVGPAGQLVVGITSGMSEFAQSSGAFIARLHTEKQIADKTGSLGTEWPNGLTIDGAGNLYWNFAAINQVLRFNIAGGEVTGEFGGLPKFFESFAFFTGIAVSRSSEVFLDEGNAIQVISSSCKFQCTPDITFSSPLLTGGVGLAVDSSRETTYIAETAGSKVESIVPEPPSAPLVEAGSESVSDVSGDSATLEAMVEPRSEPSEAATSYRFQYATEERFQREGFAGASTVPVPDGQLTPNFEADPVAAHAQGLAPGTVYHYRVVAENAISRKEGKPVEGERNGAGEEVQRTFVTQTPSAFLLPDDRVWELVSPANKYGALIEPIRNTVVTQASADGDAVTYGASASTEAAPDGNPTKTQVLSTRSGAGPSGWGSRDLSTPRELATGLVGTAQEYRFFSADLSLSIVNPVGAFDPGLSAEASEQTAFLRTDFSSGDPASVCSSSCYLPLVTGAPGFANVPEGTEFGEGGCDKDRLVHGCGPVVVGASPDANHVVLASKAALTEGAPANSLYEWSGGQLQLVSVLPNGEPASKQAALAIYNATYGNSYHGVNRNAISADGSRVVWSTGYLTGTSLYLSDTVREETVQLGGQGAEFQMASSEGTRVFFTVTGALYVFEASAGEPLSTGHVSNLTPAGGVLGTPGVSQDGTSVYFVANTVLTGSETNEHGETALAGQPNLYVESDGTPRLVAVLSSLDAPSWQGLASRVSPSGRWLAFMSERSLTGYDNRDALSGQRDEEVFLFDATAGGGKGGLVCASCDPTGARPHGMFAHTYTDEALLVDRQEVWSYLGKWLAGSVPGWTSPGYQSRYLSDSGRLFFNSPDALVPSDTNGAVDVYEYEPTSVGGCTSGSTTFNARSGGCVDLVSSGVFREESAFLDASETGDDVFFLTAARLSAADRDSVADVYDARVGGGFTSPTPPPACEGDACQSPVAAPNDQTPGSLTYIGPGNPLPLLTVGKTTVKKAVGCGRGKHRVHGKCVKGKAKKARKAARAGRPGNKRRAGR